MTFTDTLKELVDAERIESGPVKWVPSTDEYASEGELMCARCGASDIARRDDDEPDSMCTCCSETARHELRNFLQNHAEDIVALVEAAQASLDRPRPDLVAVPGGGHTTRNLQEIVEFDSAARERIRAALSRLEAKP